MRRGISFSYRTALYPFSLVVVTPGRSSACTSCAITPVSPFPSYSDAEFQLKVLPLIDKKKQPTEEFLNKYNKLREYYETYKNIKPKENIFAF